MQPVSIRRIMKELQQIKTEPLEGVSLIQLNKDDFQNYVVNIRIQQGPYKGSIAHCLLKLDEKHPQVAPYMSIYIGGGFEICGHHHIHNHLEYVGFCIDILSNSVLVTSNEGTGWNPAYTIKTLLMQIQQFISDPDRSGMELPKETISEFQKLNFNYQREFIVNGETFKHSFSQPYPCFEKDHLIDDNNSIVQFMNGAAELPKLSEQNKQQEEEQKQQDNNEPIRTGIFVPTVQDIQQIENFVREINIHGSEENEESKQDEPYFTPRSSNSQQQNFELNEEEILLNPEINFNDEVINKQEISQFNQEEKEENSNLTNGISQIPLNKDYASSSNLNLNKSIEDIESEISDKDFKDCKSNISMEMEIQLVKQHSYLDNSMVKLSESQIKESLTCYLTLVNPIDDPEEIFGLPLHLEIDSLGRLQSYALTEILSYEGFQTILKSHNLKKMQFPKKHLKNKNSANNQRMYPTFKSSQGIGFNCWLPLFINKNHFERNIKTIERSISELSSSENTEFKPFMVLEVIPNLINKMFVKIFESQSGVISSVAIQAYVQMFQLLINFCERYPALQDILDKKVIDFVRSDFNRNKQVIGDFGEFFVILGASSFSFNQFEFLDLLYREQSARQMMWLENNEEFMIQFTSFEQPKPPHQLSEAELNSLSEEERKLKEIEFISYQITSEEQYENQMKSVWQHVTIGHNLLVFTIEAAKYLTNRQFLQNIQNYYSLVSDEYASHFITYTRKVRSLINNHKDFLNYIGLGQKYDTFEKVHEVFQIGIFVSNYQGYTRKKNEIDEKIHEYRPNLKHFSLECKRLFNLRLKSQVENQEKLIIKNLDNLKLEDIRLDGLKEDMNNYDMMNFSQNQTFQREEKQRCEIFKKSMLSFSKDQEKNLHQIQQNLSTPIIDKSQQEFVKKMENSNISQQSIKLGKSWQSQILKKEVLGIPQNKELKKEEAKKFYNYSKEQNLENIQRNQQNQWRNSNQQPTKIIEEVAQPALKDIVFGKKDQSSMNGNFSFRQQPNNNNHISFIRNIRN